MDRKVKKYLHDILVCIKGIEEHVGDKKRYEEFAKSRTTKMAVERELTIIGEAIKRLSVAAPEIKIENAQKIISTRNILAHEYDTVDDIAIWGIVINHLPKLKVEVERLLNS
jgi:uncharacterized protein with HEPN domain